MEIHLTYSIDITKAESSLPLASAVSPRGGFVRAAFFRDSRVNGLSVDRRDETPA